MITDPLDVDPALAERLRRTFTAVAGTITLERPDEQAARRPPAAPPARGRRKRAGVVAGSAIAALGLAAFAYATIGSEYVQDGDLPPKNPIASGRLDGVQFWLVPSFHRDVCGRPMPGVELVSAPMNKPGQEWNTGGMAYGEWRESSPGCPAVNEAPWLADPSKAAVGWTRLGAADRGPWGAMVAVHPSVTSVVVQTMGLEKRISTAPRADAPRGPRYAALAVPEKSAIVKLLLQDRKGATVAIVTRDLSRMR